MKKALKIIGITLGSVVGVSLIAVCIVVWFVFTPAKLTPIVKSYIPAFVSCQTELDTVDLTFFSTFPHFGLRLHNVALINPMDGAPSDTVAYIGDLVATVDVNEYLSNANVVINGVYIDNTIANIYVNADSVANYDVFISDTTAEDTTSSSMFNQLAIKDVKLTNVSAQYIDVPSKMNASISNINLNADVLMEGDSIATDMTVTSDAIDFALTDSTQLTASVGNLETHFSGGLGNYNNLKGTLKMALNTVSAKMGETQYLDSLKQISATVPMELTLDSLKIGLKEALLGINEHQISLTGDAEIGDDIRMDMFFSTNDIRLNQLFTLIPDELLKEYLDGIDLNGVVQLSGNVRGIMNDTLMPLITADANYSEGTVVVEGLGHDLYDVAANAHVNIDLNEEKNSTVKLNSLSAKTGKSSVTATGEILDLMNKMIFDIRANARIWLLDLKNDMPEYIFATGWADAVLTAKCDMDALTNVDLNRIKANGTINLTDFDAVYEDSTLVNSEKMAIDFKLPTTYSQKEFKEVLDLNIKSGKLSVEMLDFFKTKLYDANIRLGLSDVMDTTKDVAMACDLNIKDIDYVMEADTISAAVRNTKGTLKMFPKGKNTGYVCVMNCDSVYAKVAEDVTARTGVINIDAKAEYDESIEDALLQWNPDVKLNFNQGQIALSAIEAPIKVSKIKCELDKKRFILDQSKVILGNSDFQLKGVIKNIADYINGEDILKGELEFTSDYTDVMELMDMVSGMGDTTEVATEEPVATNTADTTAIVEEDNPFMVPLGVDIVMTTDIKKALVGKKIVEHVGGGLTIRDGVLVLEEMGFTCDAAQMQLTSMYRSARKNHLFAGLDFHLIDISIADLIDMIPDIDTIVPMLKSFSGKAEFHFAAETYLKSNYEPKFSTLRGAAAIKGKDLVVMDSETFDQISKLLLFNKKKTKNVIDSLDVEMTVFRNEVDLYPFVVSMDKYQAVLSGYHNLDMTYNYHISLTKSPLLFKLGLNIMGNLEDLKFKLAKCQYKKLYKPQKRGVVDEQILALKKTISSSLQAGVKNQDALMKD
ncbi:MAG: hypothetical protein J5588_04160 [Bacteroidales bacterium]|nr:hypothetical protein [Bacteroidales bacterium]